MAIEMAHSLKCDELHFYEKYLPNGTEANSDQCVKTGKFTLVSPSGVEFGLLDTVSKIYLTDDNSVFIEEHGENNIIIPIDGSHIFVSLPDSYVGNWEACKSMENGDNYEFTYSCELQKPVKHVSPKATASAGIGIRIPHDGSCGATIGIDIHDDVPVVLPTPVFDLHPYLVGRAEGNVNDYVKKGADPTHPDHKWWVDYDAIKTVFAQYGTLILGDDGEYVFMSNYFSEGYKAISPGGIATLYLPFQYQDWDGDPVSGAVQFNFMGYGFSITPRPGNVPTSGGYVPEGNPYVPGNPNDPDRDFNSPVVDNYDPVNPNWGLAKDGQSPLLRVFEAGLPNSSETGQRNIVAHGYLDLVTTGGLKSLVATTDGVDSYGLANDTMAVPLAGGTLTFTRNPDDNSIKYEFTLTDPIIHERGSGINSLEQYVKLIAMNNFGEPAQIDLEVQIIDDIPKLLVSDTTHELGANAVASVAGNAADYVTKGADPLAADNWWGETEALKAAFAPYGTLELGADGAYSFTLDPQSEAFRAIPTDGMVNLELPYQYKDWDGDSVQGSVQFNLTGVELSLTPRPGNVPTSGGDVPADNPYVPGNPADPDRDLNSSGAGDYDPMNPNWGQDKDGNALMRVFESGLPNGSEAGQRNVTAHGYLDIDATVGLQSIVATTDGTDSYGFEDNIMNIPINGGTLTLTQNQDEKYLKYEFTLTNPVMHETGNGINSDEQHVTLSATDNYGNVEAIGLDVQIIDDVPQAPSGKEWRLEISEPIWSGGAVFHNLELGYPANLLTPGADFNFRDGKSSVLIDPMDGKYGHFEIGRFGSVPYDGVFYFTDSEKVASVKKGETITESFSYTYIDADGDVETGLGNFIFHGPGLAPEVRFTVNENDLANGAIINELSVDGYEIISASQQSRHGTISQDDNGAWRYTLSNPIDSGAVQGSNIVQEADFFVLGVDIGIDNDPYGGRNVFGYVDIIDSVPTFTASQGRLAYDFGADNGPGSGLKVAIGGAETDLVPGIETMIAGQHGMLTLSPDGSCHYSPNSDYAGEDIFNFTITDSDGDRALAKVIASVVDGLPQTVISVQTADELVEIEALGVPDGDSGGFIGA